MKQTRMTERYTVHWWDGIKYIVIYKIKIQLGSVSQFLNQFSISFFFGAFKNLVRPMANQDGPSLTQVLKNKKSLLINHVLLMSTQHTTH